MISVEYGPESPHVTLNIGDEVLMTYLKDNEVEAALKEADPVKWLVGTIALAKEEMPSDIGDADLMAHVILGQRGMDFAVYSETEKYLGSNGYSWISGCFG